MDTHTPLRPSIVSAFTDPAFKLLHRTETTLTYRSEVSGFHVCVPSVKNRMLIQIGCGNKFFQNCLQDRCALDCISVKLVTGQRRQMRWRSYDEKLIPCNAPFRLNALYGGIINVLKGESLLHLGMVHTYRDLHRAHPRQRWSRVAHDLCYSPPVRNSHTCNSNVILP